MKFIDQAGVPTLQEAREAVAEWIEVYHATAHRGQGMDRQSPRAVWSTARSLRKADP